ncbi:hypothetical protein GCM10029964_052250 [Kibdelosporangium lantanae]
MSSASGTTREPIAVVGMACRLPSAPDPARLWDLLRAGRSAIREIPADRGHGLADLPLGLRSGGYLDHIDRFDAEFFGISPREAAAMDPQQRLVLELAWEALEHAGTVPATLRGTRTGVFVGALADDYAAMAARPTRHTLTGTTRGIIANRVSYAFDLTGPSMAVDTAQSSSLVAVHLACESLWRGESTVAIAGGVNLVVDPASTRTVAEFGGLSPDGRSYTFDSRANGYVRGEGAGLVLLKPLSAALSAGDRVHAVILGSAVNNDGATEGLTVPSPAAQAAVISEAHVAAGVAPGDVQYVELHGTGTKVGDPREADGLGMAFGERAVPLRVGSVKTNVGHLEGAAGVTGLLKAVLSISHRYLPASLNFATPNPDIDFDALGLAVQVAGGEWPNPGARLVAGVSSFGMGGTNCHVVVAEPPAVPTTSSIPGVRALLLSARTDAALRELATALPLDDVPGVARSLATTRTVFPRRAAITGPDPRTGLDALAAGRSAAGLVVGSPVPGDLAVLFPGQGAQRPGMGMAVRSQVAAWRDAFDEVADALRPLLPRPVEDVIRADGPALHQTLYTQPAMFAVEVATFRLLSSFGVTPSFVAGHSIGEVAAAHVAGVLDLPAAARLIAARGRLMHALPPGGGMAAIGASEQVVTELLTNEVAVAAVNGPESTVISGPAEAVARITGLAADRGYRTRQLVVSHAFHSPLMEPMLAEFRATLSQLTYRSPRIPFVSTVYGRLVEDELRNPDYWLAHVHRPVRFGDALTTLRDLGVGVFLEAGPGTTLSGLGREAVPGAFIPTLGKSEDPIPELVGRLFTTGVPFDVDAVFPPGGPRVALPTYPFQRQRHWLDDGAQAVAVPTGPARVAAGSAAVVGESLSGVDLHAIVRAEVAAVLGYSDPSAVDDERSFRDLGLDSLGMVELRDRISVAIGWELPPGTLFSYPTTAALVTHLADDPEPAVPRPTSAADDDDPVVIVGMGCRYPGGVSSPEDLWDVVAGGGCDIRVSRRPGLGLGGAVRRGSGPPWEFVHPVRRFPGRRRFVRCRILRDLTTRSARDGPAAAVVVAGVVGGVGACGYRSVVVEGLRHWRVRRCDRLGVHAEDARRRWHGRRVSADRWCHQCGFRSYRLRVGPPGPGVDG